MRVQSAFSTERDVILDLSLHAKRKVFSLQHRHRLALTEMTNDVISSRLEGVSIRDEILKTPRRHVDERRHDSVLENPETEDQILTRDAEKTLVALKMMLLFR